MAADRARPGAPWHRPPIHTAPRRQLEKSFDVTAPRVDNRPVNNHSRTDFFTKPTLVGEKVTLRPFLLEEDAPVLRALLQDPEVGRLTGSVHGPADPEPWDEAAERRMREWYGTRNEQPDRLDLAVVDRVSGACVGEAVLNEWDDGNRSCNFRIALATTGQNRGLGTEAVRLMVGYGFERLGLHRISLTVFDFNPRARRAYEKVGFVKEGVHRDVLFYDGAWVDDVVMSILAPEWERHCGHPESIN
ncbi:GNAT family N-acetyltransferase [Microtetraspora glauca]|uniref:GNAT family protein n=1 Tax=Microtetraspora glauca TaxID=1996 RepID=A0ABV3GSL0_MICGL